MRLLLQALACCCMLPLAASSAAEQPWNHFRGGDGSGLASATGMPTELGEKVNVKWKTPIEGKAWSSPVVWDKQIWVTNATEDGKKLSAVAINAETGAVIHDITVFEIAQPMFCYPMNSYGSPTPAIEAGRVYVSYGSAGTACLDTASGKVLWSRQDLKCDHFRGPASSPVIYGDSVLLQFDGFDVQYVVALNKQTGETVWKHNRAFDYKTDSGDNKKGFGTPAIFNLNGRDVAVCPAAVATEALDAKTGELIWTLRHEGMNASARPLYGEGLMFITNGMGKIVAFKPEGTGDITQDKLVWSSHKSVAKRSSPILISDLLYMVTDDGIATCVEAKTGDNVWTKRLGGEFSSSPVSADGRIYFLSMNGEATVVATGRKFEEISRGKFDDGFMASPAITGKALLVRSKKALYRIEQ